MKSSRRVVPAPCQQSSRTHGRLFEWARENNVRFGPIELREVDGLRGLHATADIDPGASVLHVPADLVITREAARDSRFGRLVSAAGREVSERGQIAAQLLSTQRDGGFWSPYIRSLPDSLPDHPLCIDAALLHGLDKSGIASAVLTALRADCKADLAAVRGALAGADDFGTDEFTWAYACVVSREFELQTAAFNLFPIVDMINHSAAPSAACEHDAQGVTVRARHRIPCGSEITIDYGPRSNSHLFPMYGFCHVDSPFEEAPIFTPAGCFHVGTVYSSDATRKLFTALRAASPDAPHPRRGQDGELMPSDRLNETSALALLRDAARWRLDNFETTLQQDDALIHAGGLTRLETNIILTRRSEKRVLEHYRDLAQAVLRFLADPRAMSADELRRRVGDDDYAADLAALARA